MDYKFKRAKKAGITVEVAVTTLLSITVLCLVLGLFNQNINVMAANGNFNNLFNRKHSTEQNFVNKDYQNSQIDVRIVADQGLQAYLEKTQKSIDGLMAQTTPITKDQKFDLAKYETIKSIINNMNRASTPVSWDNTEMKFCTDNGLQAPPFKLTLRYITVQTDNGTTPIAWNPQGISPSDVGEGANDKTKEQLQVAYLDSVSNVFDNY